MILLFDVDGTLTPSRGQMDPDFKKFFLTLPNFSLVTGSDYPKTIEQVGEDVFKQAHYCFNCSGSDVYLRGKHMAKNSWKPSNELIEFLEQTLSNSPYPERHGNHIEVRPGMLNFSVVGRNSVGDQRTNYFKWDENNNERQRISVLIRSKFHDLAAEVGGETGIDVYPKGNDKSQVLKYFSGNPIHFFGDRCDPSGNDYSIASRIKKRKTCQVSHVKNWEETWQILKNLKFTSHQTAA